MQGLPHLNNRCKCSSEDRPVRGFTGDYGLVTTTGPSPTTAPVVQLGNLYAVPVVISSELHALVDFTD
jgi:hypothetical protein